MYGHGHSEEGQHRLVDVVPPHALPAKGGEEGRVNVQDLPGKGQDHITGKQSQVSGQDQLAELVGTDEYWIQASLPVDRLSWIMIPRNSGEPGSKVRIFYRNGIELSGTVIKLLGELEAEGRMARVLVEVKDPLGLNVAEKKHPPLLIGEYVRMEIEGRQLKNVYRIPRTALRDNTRIWLITNDAKLEIRDIETLWRDAKTVLLREGLKTGDQLIVSDLPTPVNGIPVQVNK